MGQRRRPGCGPRWLTRCAWRSLTATEIDQIIQAEIGERVRAAADYDRGGQPGPAQRLRAEADALRRLASGDEDGRA